MEAKMPDPTDIVVADALRAFAEPTVFEALTRLAEDTLGRRMCAYQFLCGLSTLLGSSGGKYLYHVLCRFDYMAVQALADRFGIEPHSRRNLALFIARWAPVMNTRATKDRLKGCEVYTRVDSDGETDYELLMLNGDGGEIITRMDREVALDVVGRTLSCLAQCDALPKEFDPELIKRFRMRDRGDHGDRPGD